MINNSMMPVYATRVLANARAASGVLGTQSISMIKRVKGTPKIKVKHEDYSQYVKIVDYVPSVIRQIITEITPMIGNYAKKNNLTISFSEGGRITDVFGFGSGRLANIYNSSTVKVAVSNNDSNRVAANSFVIQSANKPDRIRQVYEEISKTAKKVM